MLSAKYIINSQRGDYYGKSSRHDNRCAKRNEGAIHSKRRVFAMVNVVDCIMGGGKTQAAIRYINDHPEKKFLVITPYLDETERFRSNCPAAKFWTPSNHIQEFSFKKSIHFAHLVEEERNIATTHSLFALLSDEVVADIAARGYTVFIDEVVDILGKVTTNETDMDVIVDSGRLIEDNDVCTDEYFIYKENEEKKYDGGYYSEIFDVVRSRRLVYEKKGDKRGRAIMWTLQRELFTLSDEVYVLTYLFHSSQMQAFLKIHSIPYQIIGVVKDVDGNYLFSDTRIAPDYVRDIPNKIHICDNRKLNAVGENRRALSANWVREAAYLENGAKLEPLRKSLQNWMRNYHPNVPANQRLWTTFKAGRRALSGGGYTKRFLPFNCRATNAYRNCRVLAYCANVFFDPVFSRYYKSQGVELDADAYALSTMIQWIWRSAIRDGKEIWIYVPSRRMRELLEGWLNKLSKGEM